VNQATRAVVRTGWTRGWTEYRKSFTDRQDAFNYFGVSACFLVVAFLLRDFPVEDTGVSLGALTTASIIGFVFTMGGIVTAAQILATERENGTLLRAKTLPRGLTSYVLGKAVHVQLVNLTNVVIVLLPALLLLEGFGAEGIGDWGVLVLVFVLAATSTVPIGAIIGALIRRPRTTMNLVMVPVMGLTLVSGIFFPISTMPAWTQWIAQIFPVYWVGLGTRSVFLPDSTLAAEIGGSWRLLEMAGVLGLWSIVGLLVAPAVLRRMARRESGSGLSRRREGAARSAA
jgi:ABC-2 type transport system permease protein